MNSRYEATAEISGGGKRAHFYSNINYYRQGDFLKFDALCRDFAEEYQHLLRPKGVTLGHEDPLCTLSRKEVPSY